MSNRTVKLTTHGYDVNGDYLDLGYGVSVTVKDTLVVFGADEDSIDVTVSRSADLEPVVSNEEELGIESVVSVFIDDFAFSFSKLLNGKMLVFVKNSKNEEESVLTHLVFDQDLKLTQDKELSETAS